MPGKRGNGDGAIHQRKSDGKWCASVSLDFGKRKILYGDTRKEVAAQAPPGTPAQAVRSVVRLGTAHGRRLAGLPARTRRQSRTRAHHVQRPTKSWSAAISSPSSAASSSSNSSPEHVESWLADLQSTGRGLRARQSALARLRTPLNLAVKRSHIIRNPAEPVDMPRSTRARSPPPRLTKSTACSKPCALTASRPSSPSPWALGLRRAEILGLRWEDIDLDRRTLTVRDRVNRVNRLGLIVPAGAKTEAGDQRTIVLPQTIIAALTTHRTRQLQTKLLAGSRWQGPAYTPATCAFAARARAVRQP